MTHASFQSSGSWPDDNDCLYINDKVVCTDNLHMNLRHKGGVGLHGPVVN